MVHVERHYLIAACEMPDGTFSMEEQRPSLAQRVRDGDPVYGWTGDPALSLAMNTDYHDPADGYRGPCWEVWRRHEDGSSSVVMRKKGTQIDDAVLLRLLAEHDTRYHDVGQRVWSENEQLRQRRAAEFGDYCEERADRLADALARDLGEPAPDGRIYPLGAA